MTEVRRYWAKRRNLALLLLVALIGGMVCLKLLVNHLSQAQAWLASAWSTSDSSQKLQIVGLVINSTLTSILVLATLAYVWLTRSTVGELVEGRRAAKRPVLAVQLSELRFNPDGTECITMTCDVGMVNLGSAALFAKGLISMPKTAPVDSGKDWLDAAITTSLCEIPQVMQTGQQILSRVMLPVVPYVVPDRMIPEFCELCLKFEDSERNLYAMTQRFDLFSTGKRYHLTLKYDSLSVLPFRKRTYVGDDSLMSRFSGDDNKWELLYRRVGFL
jgi:hypothetical protein